MVDQVFDGALLIVIFATSGALEAVATKRTEDSVRGLLDLAPATATRLTDAGGEVTVPTERLAVGDVLLVRPGERVGADGRVLDGASEIDQATITGEPLPVAKQAGDEVFAGTLNGSGGLRVAAAENFTSTPGLGVAATVKGVEVAVGSPGRLLPGLIGPDVAEVIAGLERQGRTVVLVTLDGAPAGVLAVADRLRPDAAGTVAALTVLTGSAPVLVTGDNPRAATVLASEVGITDVRAGLLPQDKVRAVRQLEDAGRKVLVVGDGVNDAPALAAAHIGIAMGRAGSDLALETADVVVVRDELAAIPAVVALSRHAKRLVVQNLVIAAVFITGLVVWDLVGDLPLPLGVAGHEGSTVIVGLNGLRLLREKAWHRARTTSQAAISSRQTR